MYFKVYNTAVRALVIPAFILFLLNGCEKCLDFEDLAQGTTYSVNAGFTTNNTVVNVKDFIWGNGQTFTGGHATVSTGNAPGSGSNINTNNCTLVFEFPYPVSKVRVSVGDHGGNENLIINTARENVNDLAALNGTTVAGVNITVNGTAPSQTLTLEGNIEDFGIGGQELWVDDVCYTP